MAELPTLAWAIMFSVVMHGFSGSLCRWVMEPSTVSSALQEILPEEVDATQVYRPASSGLTCWKMRAKESSSSFFESKYLNEREQKFNSYSELDLESLFWVEGLAIAQPLEVGLLAWWAISQTLEYILLS